MSEKRRQTIITIRLLVAVLATLVCICFVLGFVSIFLLILVMDAPTKIEAIAELVLRPMDCWDQTDQFLDCLATNSASLWKKGSEQVVRIWCQSRCYLQGLNASAFTLMHATVIVLLLNKYILDYA